MLEQADALQTGPPLSNVTTLLVGCTGAKSLPWPDGVRHIRRT